MKVTASTLLPSGGGEGPSIFVIELAADPGSATAPAAMLVPSAWEAIDHFVAALGGGPGNGIETNGLHLYEPRRCGLGSHSTDRPNGMTPHVL
jgi:hypothetical protein